MTIVGIDGSTKKTGIAIFKNGIYIEHVLIDLHKMKNVDERIPQMIRDMCEYLDHYKIDKIIMEKSVQANNTDTLQKLSMLSGAIMHYAIEHGIEFDNPIPGTWRKRIGLQQSSGIKREILKLEAIRAVKQEYQLDVSDDEAEAILLARSGFELPKIKIMADDVQDDYWGKQD